MSARFICDSDNYFLEGQRNNYDYKWICIVVKEIKQDSNGNLYGQFKYDYWYVYPQPLATPTPDTNTTGPSEIEIYGVVIRDHMLIQLTNELRDRGLTVNRQGLCLAYTGDDSSTSDQSLVPESDFEAYYPLYDFFNWSKYGVMVPLHPPRQLWSITGLPQIDRFSFVYGNEGDDQFWNPNQSQTIRLNADDLFISCTDGPIFLWKVESPGGQIIKNVRLMRVIDGVNSNSQVEVHGFILNGMKLRAVCDELRGRHVMVNADGWCLFYTGFPFSASKRGRGGFYYRIAQRFDWYKYGVPISANSFIWGPKAYLDEVEPTTEFVFTPAANMIGWNTSGCEDKPTQKICVCGGTKGEQNTSGCENKPTQKICVCCGGVKDEQNTSGCENKPTQKICVCCGGSKVEQNTSGCEAKPKQKICVYCEAKVKEQNTCGCEEKPKQKICVCCGVKAEQNTSGCEAKTKEIVCGRCGTKAKEECCQTRLNEKEIELCLCETRLKEKDRELDDCKQQVE